MEYLQNKLELSDLMVIIISMISLVVSVIVLLLSYKTYILKYGQKVRGWVGEASSCTSDNAYFYTIVLENLKDKDLVVFNIYIRIGYNIYLDMLNKDDLNESYFHVIPALSVREFRFGPAINYSDGVSIVDISELIRSSKIKKRIVLSTNYGKLVVKYPTKGWDPNFAYFNNYGTTIISPIRFYSENSIYGNKNSDSLNYAVNYETYGDRTLYLVTLKRKHFERVTYPILRDTKVVYFKDVNFTEATLANKETLEKLLIHERSIGSIDFEDIEEIMDFQSYVKEIRAKHQHSETPKPESWFTYHIIDKFETIWYKLKRIYSKT